MIPRALIELLVRRTIRFTIKTLRDKGHWPGEDEIFDFVSEMFYLAIMEGGADGNPNRQGTD